MLALTLFGVFFVIALAGVPLLFAILATTVGIIWVQGLGIVLSGAALAGLAMWPFSARGRLMLVMLLGSLLPYAFTWNIGGGAEWRLSERPHDRGEHGPRRLLDAPSPAGL